MAEEEKPKLGSLEELVETFGVKNQFAEIDKEIADRAEKWNLGIDSNTPVPVIDANGIFHIPKHPNILKQEAEAELEAQKTRKELDVIITKKKLEEVTKKSSIELFKESLLLESMSIWSVVPSSEFYTSAEIIAFMKKDNQIFEKVHKLAVHMIRCIKEVPDEFISCWNARYITPITKRLGLYNGYTVYDIDTNLLDLLDNRELYVGTVGTFNDPDIERTGEIEEVEQEVIYSIQANNGFVHDIIEQPSHYVSGPNDPYEPIKIIEHFNLGFHIGNVIKYILRSGKKENNSEIQEHKKASWYLRRYIDVLERKEEAQSSKK